MFNLPAVAVMLFCAASVFSAPAYAASKEKSKSKQQITHITQLQKQLLETVQRFASSNNLTTDQISTILTSAQKYFSTKRTYEKVLFNRLMQQDPAWHRAEYASFAQNNTQDQAARVLLSLFQKYFSRTLALSNKSPSSVISTEARNERSGEILPDNLKLTLAQ